MDQIGHHGAELQEYVRSAALVGDCVWRRCGPGRMSRVFRSMEEMPWKSWQCVERQYGAEKVCGFPRGTTWEKYAWEMQIGGCVGVPWSSGKIHRVYSLAQEAFMRACKGFHTLQERHATDDIIKRGAQEVQHGLGKTCNRGSMGHRGAAQIRGVCRMAWASRVHRNSFLPVPPSLLSFLAPSISSRQVSG